jgi:hypothetical protein
LEKVQSQGNNLTHTHPRSASAAILNRRIPYEIRKAVLEE